MSDGSSTPEEVYDLIHEAAREYGKYIMGEGAERRSVDEIYEAVRQALAALDGSKLSAVSLLTGIPVEKLIELGGVMDYDAPAPGGRRDGQGVPDQGEAPDPPGAT